MVKYVVRAPEPVTDNEDQQTQQDGTAEDSDAIQTISNGKERKKYCYTILAYGVDNDAGGSDTNMLVRFDAENKKIDVVSLPRDTLMSNGHKLNSSDKSVTTTRSPRLPDCFLLRFLAFLLRRGSSS